MVRMFVDTTIHPQKKIYFYQISEAEVKQFVNIIKAKIDNTLGDLK